MEFYGRYKTLDNRLLYGFVNGYGLFVIVLGNSTIKIPTEDKANKKMKYLIKELNAIEL